MFDLRAHLADFERYHQSPANRACHWVGLLALTTAALGALSAIPLPIPGAPWADAALALLAVTLVFDLVVEWRLALGVFVAGLGCWALGSQLGAWGLVATFLVGTAFQLGGHHFFEKGSPAFTANLVHLIVGPRWLVNEILRVIPRPPRTP